MRMSLILLSWILIWPADLLSASTNNFDPKQLTYNLRTTVEAYEKAGRKNSKWDVEAGRCLTLFAQIRSSEYSDSAIREQKNELLNILPRLSEKNCDDPMIRYLFLRYISTSTNSASGNASAYQSVAGAIQESGYPDIRKFYATMWACRMLQQTRYSQDQYTNLLSKAATYLASALNDELLPERELDETCDLLLATPWWAEPIRWNCYREIEPALTNHWKGTSSALLAKGRGFLSYGWEARGKGYAKTVGDRGWRLLAERLSIAAEALEAAWQLNPRNVRVCREMMRVELGQGKGRDRLETWFQRGMKLDPANYDLCAEKLEYLRPRWYGSAQAMIEFGRECTGNTNWAGPVRLMLADAHYEYSREIQDDAQRTAYWKKPDVWPDIRLAFEQFFKLYPQEISYRHNYARYAMRCEQWQEFLNQVRLFPSTNHSYFGGVERFENAVRFAEEQTNKK